MPKLGLVLPAGTTTAAINDVSFTGSGWPAHSNPSTDAAQWVKTSKVARTFDPPSITTTGRFNGLYNSTWGYGYSPVVFTVQAIVTSVVGTKVYISNGDFTQSFSYTSSLWVGAEIESRRITNGAMAVIDRQAVTAANCILRKSALSANTVVSTTSYSFNFDSYNRPAVPYWFAVAAVDGSGQIGTYSSWASYTPADLTTATVSNSTASLTLSSTPGALAAPAGLTATANAGGNGTADLSWSAVTGASGYVIDIAYSDPATWPSGTDAYFEVADASGFAAGDLLIARKTLMALTPDMLCPRIWSANTWFGLRPCGLQDYPRNEATDTHSWTFKSFGTKPDPSLGDYYLERTVKAGNTVDHKVAWASNDASDHYYTPQPGEVFNFDIWLKASENVTLTFNTSLPSAPNHTINVTTAWQKFTIADTCISSPTASAALYWILTITAGAADLVLDMAQMRFYKADQSYGDTPTSISSTYEPGQEIRDQTLGRTLPMSYGMPGITAPAGEGAAPTGWSVKSRLAACAADGTNPWLQVEWAAPKECWIAVADEIAARIASFDHVMVEGGNENWNGIFGLIPGDMTDAATSTVYTTGEVNGIMSEMLLGWMQQSTNWSAIASKIRLYIGGWNTHDFGEKGVSRAPDAYASGVANYSGGWDTGTTTVPDESGGTFVAALEFAQVDTKVKLAAAYNGLNTALSPSGRAMNVDVMADLYEGPAPGYQLSGLNGATVTAAQAIAQEVQRKSRAMAVAQLDNVLTAMLLGWRGSWVTDLPGKGYSGFAGDGTPYLPYSITAEIAKLGRVEIHEISPVSNVQTANGVDALAAYCLTSVTNPGTVMIVALNRDIDPSVLDAADPLYNAAADGTHSLTICTGFTSATGCSVWTAGIGNMREHNKYPVGYRLTTSGTLTADPLCVAFDTSWTTKTVPSNLGRIVIDNTLGAGAGGLRGGNALLVKLTGVA